MIYITRFLPTLNFQNPQENITEINPGETILGTVELPPRSERIYFLVQTEYIPGILLPHIYLSNSIGNNLSITNLSDSSIQLTDLMLSFLELDVPSSESAKFLSDTGLLKLFQEGRVTGVSEADLTPNGIDMYIDNIVLPVGITEFEIPPRGYFSAHISVSSDNPMVLFLRSTFVRSGLAMSAFYFAPRESILVQVFNLSHEPRTICQGMRLFQGIFLSQ